MTDRCVGAGYSVERGEFGDEAEGRWRMGGCQERKVQLQYYCTVLGTVKYC